MSKHTEYLNRLGRTSASDEVYTPSKCVVPLFQFLDKSKTYYEATAGKSSLLLEGLSQGGYNIEGSKGKDFFECGLDDIYDGVVTNPPYSLKDKFIKHCYDLGNPFALLLPIASLQGQKRGAMFKSYGISALIYNKRIDFTGGGSPNFGNVWLMGNGMSEPNRLFFTNYPNDD